MVRSSFNLLRDTHQPAKSLTSYARDCQVIQDCPMKLKRSRGWWWHHKRELVTGTSSLVSIPLNGAGYSLLEMVNKDDPFVAAVPRNCIAMDQWRYEIRMEIAGIKPGKIDRSIA